jgi:hypothetical protein
VNSAVKDLDADSAAAGFARFLAQLNAAVDAGEELVERNV